MAKSGVSLNDPTGDPSSAGQKAKSCKKLEREMTIMKLIKHPNVMDLVDVYDTDHHL